METGRLERLLPLTGVVFAVLFAIAFLVSGSTPDVESSGAEIIDHYDDEAKVYFVIIVLLLAAVALMFFASYLRERLRTTGWPALATAAFGGGVTMTIALGIFGIFQIALIDAADLGQEQVAQALNIIDNDNFLPAVIGIATMYLATGWHCLVSHVLPKWLAVLSVILGVICFAGPAGFVGFLAFPIWILVVSIILFTRQGHAAAGPTGPTETV
jgi:hypothetical protein